MADQSLQAFQLGANLFDRAQTQQRMMEQFQLQTADQIMRQRQFDLQNKIQSNAYAQALEEQKFQTDEFDAFQAFNEQVANYLNDPNLESKMPALPRFKSKVFNQQAIQAFRGLEQYSPRAKILKAKEGYEKNRADIIAEMYDMGIDVYDPATGAVRETVFQENLPAARARIQEKSIVKDVDQEVREELAQLDKTIPIQERLKTARQKIEARKAERTLPSERLKADVATGAIADWEELFGTPDSRTASRIKGSVLQNDWKYPQQEDGRQIRGDELTARNSSKLIDELNKFEQTYGKGKIQKYVGIIDGNIEELLRRTKEAKTDEEKNAYGLLQRFQKVFNEEAFATSGKAVTQSEGTRLKKAIGDIKSNNFVNDVNNFANFAAEDLWNTIDSFKTKYKVTPEQVKLANELVTRYKLPLVPFGQQRQSPPAGSTGTAPSLPAGVTPFTGSTNVSSGFIYTP